MKTKILALILAMASLLAFSACSGDNDTPKNDDKDKSEASSSIESSTDNSTDNSSDNSSDDSSADESAVIEETVYPAAGTWKQIGSDRCYFIIDNSGDLTKYYVDSEFGTNSYEFTPGKKFVDVEWNTDTVKMYYTRKGGGLGGGQYFTFEKIGDHYAAYDENGVEYYREEDLKYYDVVELTTENISDYIEDKCTFTCDTNAYNEVTKIYAWNKIVFKEGLGAASYVTAEITYNYNYYTATYNHETKEIAWGEITRTDAYNGKPKSISVNGAERKSDTGWGKKFTDNGDGTYTVEMVDVIEVTGAEKIIGKVYIPKDWNK